MNYVLLEEIPLAAFEAALKTSFRLTLADAPPVELELSGVIRARSGESSEYESFSLVFRGPRDPTLPQRIYRIEHDRIGAFDLFLVPIACEADGMKYEAVFNRRRTG